MARKRRKAKRRWAALTWWSELDEEHRRRAVVGGALLVVGVSLIMAASYGLQRLDQHVKSLALADHPRAEVVYANLPDTLVPLARADLDAALNDLTDVRWTDATLCRRMAKRLAEVGWVDRVEQVRRGEDARFVVRAAYRYPVAMVQYGTEFFLVDAHGVRLPGSYRFDPRWPLVQGAAAAAPNPGQPWPGGDVQAGLAILDRVMREPFADQITAALIDNFGGRQDRFGPHLFLATDRAGGRIAWGSAIGQEVEENSVEQKLALLRANFRDTGRADAGHTEIDISTFPDRFTVPG